VKYIIKIEKVADPGEGRQSMLIVEVFWCEEQQTKTILWTTESLKRTFIVLSTVIEIKLM